jgi:hypothetical protein
LEQTDFWLWLVFASSPCGLAVEPGQAGKVIGEVGKADLGPGADQVNGAHNQAEPAFWGGKDVLDPRAHPDAGGVSAGDVPRHLAAARLFALELRLEAAALEQGETAFAGWRWLACIRRRFALPAALDRPVPVAADLGAPRSGRPTACRASAILGP